MTVDPFKSHKWLDKIYINPAIKEITRIQRRLDEFYNPKVLEDLRQYNQVLKLNPNISETTRQFKQVSQMNIALSELATASSAVSAMTTSDLFTKLTEISQSMDKFTSQRIREVSKLATLPTSLFHSQIQSRFLVTLPHVDKSSLHTPAFDALPEYVKEKIQSTVAIEEVRQIEHQKKPGSKRRSRSIKKIQKTTEARNLRIIIDLFALYDILIRIEKHVTDPVLLQDILEKLMVLHVYINYLSLLLEGKY